MKEDIAGTWELARFDGYLFQRPPLPPGNGNIFVLTKSGTFEKWKHDTLVFRGNYSLRHKNDCKPRDSEVLFIANDGLSRSYIEVVDGELTFSSPACMSDGGTTFYRRIK